MTEPSLSETEIMNFYQRLRNREEDDDVSFLADWIEQQCIKNPTKVKCIREAQNAVLLPLLLHTDLLAHVIQLAKSGETTTRGRRKVKTVYHRELVLVWSHINKVKHNTKVFIFICYF